MNVIRVDDRDFFHPLPLSYRPLLIRFNDACFVASAYRADFFQFYYKTQINSLLVDSLCHKTISDDADALCYNIFLTETNHKNKRG